MTAYQFSQPWLSKQNTDQAANASEWAHLRTYLQGLDNGTISLFNPNFLNMQVNGTAFSLPVSVANGGTGLTTLTSGSYLKGNGTGNVTFQAAPIPVADGGTNSTTGLNNNRIIISSGSKIVEQSALTASRVIVTDSNGLPVTTGVGNMNGNLGFISTSTQGIVGTTTNDSAASGNVGEVIAGSASSGAPVTLSTGTAATICSISVPAGQWTMTGIMSGLTGATTITSIVLSISTTNNASGGGNSVPDATGQVLTENDISMVYTNGSAAYFGCVTAVAKVASTTTYYWVINAAFSGSTLKAFGSITATRTR